MQNEVMLKILQEQDPYLINLISKNRIFYYVTKRIIDFILAILLLLLFLPIMIVIAILIKLDSPGPVIYSQKRVGCKFKWVNKSLQSEICSFTFYKFRSMYQNTNEGIHREFISAYIQNDRTRMDSLQPTKVLKRARYKLQSDRRITRIGQYLRRTSLDELPQFWNVIKGDMSLVGPRPAIPYEVEMYEPWHQKRLYVKPGLTGLWQVTTRNSSTFKDMVKIDLEYIEKQSVWLDMKILFKTPIAVFQRKCD